MERLLRIIVRTEGADDARRKLDRVIEKERGVEKAIKQVTVAERSRADVSNRSWNATTRAIDKAEKSVEKFNREMRNATRNERDMLFASQGPQFGKGRNANPFFTSSGPGAPSAVQRAVSRGGPGMLGTAAAATNVRTLGTQIVRLASSSGIATGAVSALGGATGVAGLAAAIGPVLGTVGLPAVAAALLAIPMAAGPMLVVFHAVKGVMKVFTDVWGSFKKAIDPALSTIQKQLAPAFNNLRKALIPLFSQLGGWIEGLLPVAIPVMNLFINVFAHVVRMITLAAKAAAFLFDYGNPVGIGRIISGEEPIHQKIDKFQKKLEAQEAIRHNDDLINKAIERGELKKEGNLIVPKKADPNSGTFGSGPSGIPLIDQPNRSSQRTMSRYDIQRLVDGALGQSY